MNLEWPILVAIAVVIIVLILVPAVRRVVGRVIYAAVVIAAILFIIIGLTLFSRNVALYDSPGIGARLAQFLSHDYAATSSDGAGSAPCEPTPPSPAVRRIRRAARGEARRHQRAASIVVTPSATPTPAVENFPELVQRGYPGIAPDQLFKLSTAAVANLKGWTIVSSDPRAGKIDCTVAGAMGLDDNVKIRITPQSEVHLCSQSVAGLPGSTSLLRFFPGDLGANIGNIKAFYGVLEPATEKVYKQIERRESKRPGR